jgi:hypothetical protein
LALALWFLTFFVVYLVIFVTDKPTDWRALCAELVAMLDAQALRDPEMDGGLLRRRARARLAQPEPEGPTNEEIDALERKCWKLESLVEHDLRAGFSEAFPKDETFDHRAFAHVVLEHWGRPTTKPVPVAKRPWEREGWCDAEGECWWCPPEGPAYWSMANPAMVYGGWLLPHNAMPLPHA